MTIEITYEEFAARYDALMKGYPGYADFAPLSDEAVVRRLYLISDKLTENAKKYNLTSIIEPDEIIRKHIADSVIPFAELKKAGYTFDSMLDVGTGAGFPLLPAACLYEGSGVRLAGMDATAKKITHIKESALYAGLTCVDAFQGRAEELSHEKLLRGQYGMVTARAVASLPVLCEICGALVKTGGFFCALKAHAEDEISAAQKVAGEMGLSRAEVIQYALPGGDDARCLVIYRKKMPTPNRLPRRYADIVRDSQG